MLKAKTFPFNEMVFETLILKRKSKFIAMKVFVFLNLFLLVL